MADPRRTFGPLLLLGLASAALAAVAGNKPWTEVEAPGGECGLYSPPGFDYSSLAQGAPLAGALSLVALAAWGVLLVTRGRVRRAVAVLATLASAGYLIIAVEAYWSLKDATRQEALDQLGRLPQGCPAAAVWMNNSWWPTALLAGLLVLVASVAAVRFAPSWPEMSSRYDAPTGTGDAAGSAGKPEEQTNLDLWKSLDEGRDPTA